MHARPQIKRFFAFPQKNCGMMRQSISSRTEPALKHLLAKTRRWTCGNLLAAKNLIT